MLNNLPSELKQLLDNTSWQDSSGGCTDVQTLRLTRPDFGNCYLKISPQPPEKELLPEKQRLEWLQGRLAVPQVLYYGEDEAQEYLLISEIPGLVACDEAFSDNLPRLVQLLAAGLRQLHNLDISNCPFDQCLEIKMELARQRMLNSLVDESDFDEERQGRTAADLYNELLATRPATEDLVFTHGDYCLPNILLDPALSQVNGFIDLGRAGIADRYQDLALAARSLDYNFGPQWIPLLFHEYGLETIDQSKIEFYKLLDEFF